MSVIIPSSGNKFTAPGSKRWYPQHKAKLIEDVLDGKIPLETAMTEHGFSEAEFSALLTKFGRVATPPYARQRNAPSPAAAGPMALLVLSPFSQVLRERDSPLASTRQRLRLYRRSSRGEGLEEQIFDRDGGAHLCNPVYPTEHAAQVDADRCLQRLRENYPTGYRAQLHDGAWVNVSEISHCLQIPWNRP